jgi:hypothetical protein
MKITVRSATPADYQAIHAINEGVAPAVSNISVDELRRLAMMCCDFSVVPVNLQLAGFMMAMEQGEPYESMNYRWFAERYKKFVYVDRIAVSPAFKGLGIGRALYANIEKFTRKVAPVLTCEVNVIPRNEDSLAFHAKLGFIEVGQQDTEGGKKRVSLQVKQLSAA